MLIKRFRWLQIILLALLLGSLPFLAGCGGETADSRDTEPVANSEDDDDDRDEVATQDSVEAGNEELSANTTTEGVVDEPAETTPTPDPQTRRIRLLLTTLAKDANDLYVKGDMVGWREKSTVIIEALTALDTYKVLELLNTEDYTFFGFRSDEQYVTAKHNLFVFSAAMLYETDELDLAKEFINLVLASGNESNLSLAFSLQGSIYRREENHAEAIESYLKAIELNPNNAQAYLGLGQVEAGLSRSNYDLSREYFSQALSINDRYGRALTEYGATYFWEFVGGEGNGLSLDIARDYLDDAILNDPGNSFAYMVSADLYSFQGNYTRCSIDATAGIELEPLPMFYLIRGECYAEQGLDGFANTDFNRALELDPNNEYIINQVTSYRSSNTASGNTNVQINEDDLRGEYVDQCPYGYLGETWFDSSGRLKVEECMSPTDFGLSAHQP